MLKDCHETTQPDHIHFGKNSRIADIVIDDDRAMRVASHLLNADAYLIDTSMPKEEYYTWKSGVRAPCYCNCRYALANPESRRVISDELAGSIRENFGDTEWIVGVATAGIAWATAIADRLQLPTAYILSEKKTHGVGGFVQGHVASGARVVIIDDLVASGGSLRNSIDALCNEVHVEVVGIISIINWGFSKMRQNLAGLNVISMTSYPQIIMAATNRGKVSQNEFSRLLNFYINPSQGY